MVGRYPLARTLRGLDPANDRSGLTVDVDAERFDMGDVDWEAAAAADGDSFVDRAGKVAVGLCGDQAFADVVPLLLAGRVVRDG